MYYQEIPWSWSDNPMLQSQEMFLGASADK